MDDVGEKQLASHEPHNLNAKVMKHLETLRRFMALVQEHGCSW